MDWNTFEKEVETLSKKIDLVPDLIVGISRGGVVPARLLCEYLDIKELHFLSVQKVGEERKVVTDLLVDLQDKKVLLVEDMLETGKSLVVAKKYLESKGAAVKTACLYTMPHSEIVPDFFLKQVEATVLFPWE